MATPNVLGVYELLRRAMQEETLRQQGADYGSSPNVSPSQNYGGYGSSQGGLLGRLLALQGEQSQYKPFARNDGAASFEPLDPNFRQLSRAPITNRTQRAIDLSGRLDELSRPSYSPFGDNASLDVRRMSSAGDRAAQPRASFPDRIQASWDHPAPHGLVSMLKGALNGIAEAVQGSMDATSVPSTEEEAFRQNLGRERGPIGAWDAASLAAPAARGVGSGIFTKPLVGASRTGLPSLPMGTRGMGQGIADSIATTSTPPLRFVLGDRSLPWELKSPADVAKAIASLAGVLPRNPLLPPPMSTPGLEDWKEPVSHEMAPRKGGGRKIEDDDDDDDYDESYEATQARIDKSLAANRERIAAAARERGKAVKTKPGTDPDDPCANQCIEEEKRCYERSWEYPHWDYRRACIDRAQKRRTVCRQNGGDADATGLKEWSSDEEETYRNYSR